MTKTILYHQTPHEGLSADRRKREWIRGDPKSACGCIDHDSFQRCVLRYPIVNEEFSLLGSPYSTLTFRLCLIRVTCFSSLVPRVLWVILRSTYSIYSINPCRSPLAKFRSLDHDQFFCTSPSFGDRDTRHRLLTLASPVRGHCSLQHITCLPVAYHPAHKSKGNLTSDIGPVELSWGKRQVGSVITRSRSNSDRVRGWSSL